MPKIIRRRFLIGIDTSMNKKFSYLVFGPANQVNQLKSDIEHICLRNGVKKLHFNEIDPPKRKKIYPEIVNSVLKYKNVTYDVLRHEKPLEYENKDFYFNFLTEEYAKEFAFLKNKDGIVRIDIHDDFRVTNVNDSTSHFIDCLADAISKILADKSGFFRNKKEGIVYSTITCKETGNTLKLNLRKVSEGSSAVIVADIVLGFHQLKFKTLNRLLPQTQFDKEFIKKAFYKNLTP